MPFPDCREVREFRGYREEADIVLCFKGHLGSNSISCICLPKVPMGKGHTYILKQRQPQHSPLLPDPLLFLKHEALP